MTKEREIAIKAARAAGQLILERVGAVGKIDYKGAFNLVTEVDKGAEKIILDILRPEFPNDKILAEESGASEGADNSRRWLIDPIDGTTNFAHSYPMFCVSIGLEQAGKFVMGVVFNPVSNELFWAETGKGAWLNEKQIKVSKVNNLSESLLATGFHAKSTASEATNREIFMHITDTTHGVRRDGSAALDLCFVACGRTEGFWESKLALWDIAAGAVIVEEAGGKITDMQGRMLDLSNIRLNMAASNNLIHNQLLDAFKSAQVAIK